MWQAEDIVIISDLHLAPERDKGLFQADKELAAFLGWVLKEVRRGVVILNGDILDFLVTSDEESAEDTFNLTKIAGRTKRVIEMHTEVFRGLAELAQSPDHDLWMIGGNHDPEIALPAVRWEIEKRLSPARSTPSVRWLLNGEGVMFRVGEAVILVEHGDIYDSWNRIDHEALRRELMLASRGLAPSKTYRPPPGSRLIVNHLSELRQKYLWVDMLKPERETVIPLLYAFADTKQKYRLRGAVRELIQVGRRSILRRTRRNPASLYRTGLENERRLFGRWAADLERNVARSPWRKRAVDNEIEDFIPKLRQVSIEW